MIFSTAAGWSEKLGVTLTAEGANFCVYARLAYEVELLLFDHEDDAEASHIFRLSSEDNRTAYYWHIFISGIKPGQLYAYRVHGPYRPFEGTSFDKQKVLIDPYGILVSKGKNYDRHRAAKPGCNEAHCLKSIVADVKDYDWEDDKHPRHTFSKTVIYEMHVAGFTRHTSSGVEPNKRGTYAGLIEKIPYLKELGVTAVELLPVYQFDEDEHHAGLCNYWGYSPISFFAPHRGYSSDKSMLGPLNEFRDMVKALHKADIEVILDVVYNHTAEGGVGGPTLCFRGFDNDNYYILSNNKQDYMNFSGCGNTFNGTHSVCRRLIIDSLHFWVEEMHVDGFRFDLASILSRDEQGMPMVSPPTLYSIDTDPALSSTKLIAEAWDAGGLYQVGNLAGQRWREWNGQFRDDVRKFIRGDEGMVSKFADRLIGSPDIYGHHLLEPEKTINFVTCHDGFTLLDLVSYNEKKNWANGEENRDGSNDNYSWNHGIEGETDDIEVNQLRIRQVKNMLATTLLSLGTPMIQMGDEVGRTQHGNNNGYCQNNEDFWFDWSLVKQNNKLFNFTKALIHQRVEQGRLDFAETKRLPLNEVLQKSGIRWHGVRVGKPDWSSSSRTIAIETTPYGQDYGMYAIFNAFWEPLEFELPIPKRGFWTRFIDTSLPYPEDILTINSSKVIVKNKYVAQPRSVVILIC
ncbi:glycogen debranching protein GlgX [Motilimonas sp. E26]|uniref:glycogen debranching protein GlgX n=1 Tax=Motilimonas sp. E26 TaxID=2865674 RepID=UPI001E623FE4|nr:glycogen debranching protein GlgX [Motilimonas sp. E26]